jgi:UDP-N-acetylmuramate dehydrogenase
MKIENDVPLAPYTTLGVGGRASHFVVCTSEEEIYEALQYAREHHLPIAVLSAGSNTLIPDEGFHGLVVKIAIRDISWTDESQFVTVSAGAGEFWDNIVKEAALRSLWGIENLAGIPGSVGGAVVQNIGAYGTELSEVFIRAEAIHKTTGESIRIDTKGAHFNYRDSIFKQNRELVIVSATFRLARTSAPRLAYPDLKKAKEARIPLSTPREIGEAVRQIRQKKFPVDEGTAGSFFKNPILSRERAQLLHEAYPDIPQFPTKDGFIKIPLAWVLDHVLHLKGHAYGHARLFENQPIVIAVRKGAMASDVDMLAKEVVERVHSLLGLSLEREVETLLAR